MNTSIEEALGYPLPLTQGKIAIIPYEAAEQVTAFGKWYAILDQNRWYAATARRNETPSTIRLHSYLTGYPRVDHINGNGLDNRWHNLRPANDHQNSANRRKISGSSSHFKGVSWCNRDNIWKAQIEVNSEPGNRTAGYRRPINLGHFTSEEEAAHVYDKAAIEHFGEYALTNEMLRLY
jgi:hypothetical protein